VSGEHSPAESGEDAAGERTPGGRLRARLERHALAVVALATAIALVVMFYYPVATVFVEALFEEGRVSADGLTLEVFPELLGDSLYVEILRFTAYQALLSTLLSVALGVPLAYLLARYEFPGRQTLRSLTILPFVLPGIMVGVGFRAAFAESGPLNQLLGLVGLGPVELLFTLEGIVIAHAFYNAPLVARLLVAAWEGVDASAVETARSLGASRLRAFRDVVAPQLYPAVLTGGALTFVFSFGTFPIVQALGGTDVTTVEVQIFRLVERLDYRTAAALAIVELFITLGVLYAYLRYEARQRGHSRGVRPLERHSLVPTSLSPRPVAVRLGLAAYLLVAVVLFVLPIASMIQASFTDPGGFTLENYRFLIERQADAAAFQIQPWPAVRNSLLFGAATLLVALPMGVTVAVYSTRAYAGRKLLDAAAMAPFAVSSIVVGIGLLRGPVFGVDIAGVHLAVGGAVAIVAAHAVAAYPFVVRTVAPGLERIDETLVESARALGASRTRALVDIELRMVWPGLVAGAAFVFAISIGEFSSTVILASGTDWYTMPVAIERFIGRRLGPAYAMGVVLLVVTTASFVLIDRLGGERSGGF
jgi:thiamine transport system permease protein